MKPIKRPTVPLSTEREPERLQKALAGSGLGSRRAIEELIIAGQITVNGEIAELGQRVGLRDRIRVRGKLVQLKPHYAIPRVILYHKPAGEIVSYNDPQGRPTVFEKLPKLKRGKWVAVGRLDFMSEGLLLFTTSGELANRLMHPRYNIEREYAVRVRGVLRPEQANRLLGGIELKEGVARALSIVDGGGEGSNHWYKLVLLEGRNREVRRLFAAIDLTVSRLIRIRYGSIRLPPRLKRGQQTELAHDEVSQLVKFASSNDQSKLPQGRGGK